MDPQKVFKKLFSTTSKKSLPSGSNPQQQQEEQPPPPPPRKQSGNNSPPQPQNDPFGISKLSKLVSKDVARPIQVPKTRPPPRPNGSGSSAPVVVPVGSTVPQCKDCVVGCDCDCQASDSPCQDKPLTRVCPNCKEILTNPDMPCGCDSFVHVSDENIVNNNVVVPDPTQTEEYKNLEKEFEAISLRFQTAMTKHQESLTTIEELRKTEKKHTELIQAQLQQCDDLESKTANLEEQLVMLKKSKKVEIENLQQSTNLNLEREKIEERNALKAFTSQVLEMFKGSDVNNNNNLHNKNSFIFQEESVPYNYPIGSISLDKTLHENGDTTIEVEAVEKYELEESGEKSIVVGEESDDDMKVEEVIATKEAPMKEEDDRYSDLRKLFTKLRQELTNRDLTILTLRNNQVKLCSNNSMLCSRNEGLMSQVKELQNSSSMLTSQLEASRMQIQNLVKEMQSRKEMSENERLESSNKANREAEELKEKISSLELENNDLKEALSDAKRQVSTLALSFNEKLKLRNSEIDLLRREIEEKKDNVVEVVDEQGNDEKENRNTFTCPLCFGEYSHEDQIEFPCGHRMCWQTDMNCVKQHVLSSVHNEKFPCCPVCQSELYKEYLIPEYQIEWILSQKEVEEYHKLCLKDIKHHGKHH